jgi:hypothetical protein
MAYTIVKSDGIVLTTIADGTINTSSTSLGLPGRNYAGYGETIDTNFVHITENFADGTPPSNALRGQIWYDTSDTTLKVCPTDGESNALAWLSLTSTSSGGATTFGSVTVTGNLSAGNITATTNSNASAMTTSQLTVSTTANIATGNIVAGEIGTFTTTSITSGSQSTQGTLTGVWTANGAGTANAVAGTAMWVTGGNLVVTGAGSVGIKTNNFYYANGDPIPLGAAAYSNANVAAYLPTYTGNVGTGATIFNGTTLNAGANTTAGAITGNWTLTTGSRLTATYADLAERFSADDVYTPGTVVQLGGSAEVTAVKYELSEDVFGVISDNMAFLMNDSAGNNDSHPAVAMTGRVKVNTIGKVLKGQRLVSAGKGIARAAKTGEATAFNVIGRALTDKYTSELGTVEAIVTIK